MASGLNIGITVQLERVLKGKELNRVATLHTRARAVDSETSRRGFSFLCVNRQPRTHYSGVAPLPGDFRARSDRARDKDQLQASRPRVAYALAKRNHGMESAVSLCRRAAPRPVSDLGPRTPIRTQ